MRLLLLPLLLVLPKNAIIAGYIIMKMYDNHKTKLRVVKWNRFFLKEG